MSVPIMKFRAGATGYAVAAGCVEGVGPVRPDVPHLANLLAGAGTAEGGARTLQLVSGNHRVELTVDGPVEIVELTKEALTPCRTSLSSRILGFAHLGGEVYALLDTERLVELARASSAQTESEQV